MSDRVVLAEDDALTASLLLALLRPITSDVVHVTDGTEAMDAIDALPDLLILDLNLPNRTGLEVLRTMRNRKETAKIPVLVVSAHDQADTRERVDRHGAEFLAKPIRPDTFQTTVRRLLEKS